MEAEDVEQQLLRVRRARLSDIRDLGQERRQVGLDPAQLAVELLQETVALQSAAAPTGPADIQRRRERGQTGRMP